MLSSLLVPRELLVPWLALGENHAVELFARIRENTQPKLWVKIGIGYCFSHQILYLLVGCFTFVLSPR